MQGPEIFFKKNVIFLIEKKVKNKWRNIHSRSLSVQTGCDPRSAADRRLPPAKGSGRLPGDRFPTGGRPSLATAPARVPHFVHPLPNLLAHKILHVRSTLPHWLQHMPTLPRLLLETSNIHNF
jgi:hypothetical protein